MALTRTDSEKSYDFTTSEDVEKRIRTDLSRVGNVSEVNGKIMIVDGDWFLVDVHAVVDGRKIRCVKSNDKVTYHHKGGALKLEEFDSPYADVTSEYSSFAQIIGQAVDGYHLKRREVITNISIGVFLITGLLAVTGIIGALITTVIGLAADPDAIQDVYEILPAIVILLSVAGLAFLVGDWNMFETLSQKQVKRFEDDLNREAIRLCVKKGFDYEGKLTFHMMEGAKDFSVEGVWVRFAARSAYGEDIWCYTNGFIFKDDLRSAK